MRTYSHALLTYATARRSGAREAAWAAAGAALPDLPAAAGAALVLRRPWLDHNKLQEKVCSRRRFGVPDTVLHSALPVAAALALCGKLSPQRRRPALAFLMGWAGHVATDALTHGSDARPFLWPVSGWRFASPVAYRECGRHGLAFTVAEHAALLGALGYALREGG